MSKMQLVSRKVKLKKKPIEVLKMEFWDGSVYYARPNIPGAEERIRILISNKRTKFQSLPPIRQLMIKNDHSKKVGGLAEFTKEEMDEAQYNKIELFVDIKESTNGQKPDDKKPTSKNVQDQSAQTHPE
jgi:hypothetical protein